MACLLYVGPVSCLHGPFVPASTYPHVHINDKVTRQAWEASPLAILTIDANGVIRFVNPAGLRLFGRSEEELNGCPIADLTHSLDRLALQRMLDDARRGAVPTRQELRFLRQDGSEVTTGFSVAPGVEIDAHSVCVVRDLTSEKALRPQMLHTERMASMGVIASVVAHELNNALSGAIGCLELLQPGAAPDQRELVVSALQELQRSAQIVLDLKGYARVEDGMAERVEIAELIAGLVRLHRYHVNAEETPALQVHLQADLPALEGNRNQMLQALLNLVRNAEDAVGSLPEERRQLLLDVRLQDDVLRLAVIDRGPGVPSELRGRLFDPFYSTKQVGYGTGLGLTVVQAVAAGHGGRVEVSDTDGGGATFALLLPVGQRPYSSRVDVGGAQAGGSGTPRLAGPELDGVRILVADDERTVRRVIERACAAFGGVPVLAEDAGKAIERLQAEDFDVVLLDVRMPGGGGPAVFQWLQQHRPALVGKTIFMSGELSDEMREVRGEGYFDILPKPFQMQNLGEMLQRAAGRVGPG